MRSLQRLTLDELVAAASLPAVIATRVLGELGSTTSCWWVCSSMAGRCCCGRSRDLRRRRRHAFGSWRSTMSGHHVCMPQTTQVLSWSTPSRGRRWPRWLAAALRGIANGGSLAWRTAVFMPCGSRPRCAAGSVQNVWSCPPGSGQANAQQGRRRRAGSPRRASDHGVAVERTTQAHRCPGWGVAVGGALPRSRRPLRSLIGGWNKRLRDWIYRLEDHLAETKRAQASAPGHKRSFPVSRRRRAARL